MLGDSDLQSEVFAKSVQYTPGGRGRRSKAPTPSRVLHQDVKSRSQGDLSIVPYGHLESQTNGITDVKKRMGSSSSTVKASSVTRHSRGLGVSCDDIPVKAPGTGESESSRGSTSYHTPDPVPKISRPKKSRSRGTPNTPAGGIDVPPPVKKIEGTRQGVNGDERHHAFNASDPPPPKGCGAVPGGEPSPTGAGAGGNIPPGDDRQNRASQDSPAGGQSGMNAEPICQLCFERGHNAEDCPVVYCQLCDEEGHWAVDCPNTKCQICEQRGHSANDCPQQRCADCGGKGHPTGGCTPPRCQVCQGEGHVAANCPRYRDEVFKESYRQLTWLSKEQEGSLGGGPTGGGGDQESSNVDPFSSSTRTGHDPEGTGGQEEKKSDIAVLAEVIKSIAQPTGSAHPTQRSADKPRNRPKGLDPKEFKGAPDDPIHPWLEEVEVYAKSEQMDEVQHLQFIKTHVNSGVKKLINAMGKPARDDLNEVLEFLKGAYSATGAAAYSKGEFERRTQNKDESFSTYSNHLLQLRRVAYPDENPQICRMAVKDKMYQSLNDVEVRELIESYVSLPTVHYDKLELTEFVQYCEKALDSIAGAKIRGSRIRNPLAKHATWTGENNVRPKTPQTFTSNQPVIGMRPPPPRQPRFGSGCFKCGSGEHLMRQCPLLGALTQEAVNCVATSGDPVLFEDEVMDSSAFDLTQFESLVQTLQWESGGEVVRGSQIVRKGNCFTCHSPEHYANACPLRERASNPNACPLKNGPAQGGTNEVGSRDLLQELVKQTGENGKNQQESNEKVIKSLGTLERRIQGMEKANNREGKQNAGLRVQVVNTSGAADPVGDGGVAE